MTYVTRWTVWLSRIHHCRGFGIQSPTDYAFVRYVVNEHWPYYAYDELTDDDWLVRKLGRLYFRLANWRQPQQMLKDDYQRYWQAGCRKTVFSDNVKRVELARITVDDRQAWQQMLPLCDERSVVVVEGIWRNWQMWREIVADERTGRVFDLYYCGIVFFDKKHYKHYYKINF
jgi:hypothetical protein